MDFTSPGTTEWLVIAGVALLIILVLVAVMASRRRRRHSLQQRYGPEYERTVRAQGGERAARHDLSEREKEREQLELRDLDADQRRGFGSRMAVLQYRFAEDPAGAVYESGRVAADALRARGYPIADDRDRALRLLAVDHPREAQPLRTAIEGTYGKDQSRLRETFVGVRDGLRETLGIHYAYEDGVAAADRAPSTSTPRPSPGASGPAAAAAPALASQERSGVTGGEHTRRDRPDTEHDDTGRDDTGRDDTGRDDTERNDTERDDTGRRGDDAGADRDTADGSDDATAARTVRLDEGRDDPGGDRRDASSDIPPVGAVPPPPSEGDRSGSIRG